MKKIKSFTLIELLATITILALVLLIAVPKIMDAIGTSKAEAFKSDAISILKTIDLEIAKNENFNPEIINEENIEDLLELDNSNYESIEVVEVENGYAINVVGKNAWSGYVASGTEANMTVVNTNDQEDVVRMDADISTFGGSNGDSYSKIISTSDGYVAIGYMRSSNLDLIGLNNGEEDGIVVKYNFSGEEVWKKNFGGSDSDYFKDIVEVNDGYVIAGFSCSDDLDLSGINNGTCDAIILKYDFSGNVVWKKNFGGSLNDDYNSIVSVSDGYVVLGSSYSSDIDLINMNNGEIDIIIVKYDLLGNVVWKKNFGGSYYEYDTDLIAVNDGYLVIGDTDSSDLDLDPLNEEENQVGVIIKFDSLGNIVWKKITDNSRYQDGIAINDEYIMVGYTTESSFARNDTDDTLEDSLMLVMNDESLIVEDNENSQLVWGFSGAQAAIISKYDALGNEIWIKEFGGSTSEFYSVALTKYGYVAAGHSSSSSDDLEGMNNGGNDGIIVAYDYFGNVKWKENCGGTGDDRYKSATVTNDGYIAAGYSGSNDIDLFEMNNGSTDALIVKYTFQ